MHESLGVYQLEQREETLPVAVYPEVQKNDLTDRDGLDKFYADDA